MSTATEQRTVSMTRNTRHLTGAEADTQVRLRYGIEEISDECAATIAAQWQAPTGLGATFAALIGYFPVTVADLLDAIADARDEAATEGDRRALDMLATWALNR